MNGSVIRIKRIAVLLAVIFAVTVFGSAVFEAAHADHDCCGEGCAVCAQMSACENMLRSGTVSTGAVFAVMCAAAAVILTAKPKRRNIKCDTLISLKVLLLD